MRPLTQSSKLAHVLYDIRGPVANEAARMEREGNRILKLNIGNPAPFGFEAPEEILEDVISHLPTAQGYSDSKGVLSARRAVAQHYQRKNVPGVDVDGIYLGNGVSELIMIALQALLNTGDEVLVPMPDYPLWTAAASLSGGTPVHYVCDEGSDWMPDLEDIRAKVTDRTVAIVVINPNNPTGAVYSAEVLRGIAAIAREHELVLMADEIYDKIVYGDAVHTTMAAIADDLFCVSLGGLSKAYRVAGFRSGWMVLSGPKEHARDYIEGLDLLTNMRMCANVPAQHAIATALGGDQSIVPLVSEGGRLRRQSELAWRMLNEIDGVSCVKPRGALYAFPRLDTERFGIVDDERFALDLLRAEKMLIVHGTGFNWDKPDHFRLVTLPSEEDLSDGIGRLQRFLADYHQ